MSNKMRKKHLSMKNSWDERKKFALESFRIPKNAYLSEFFQERSFWWGNKH